MANQTNECLVCGLEILQLRRKLSQLKRRSLCRSSSSRANSNGFPQYRKPKILKLLQKKEPSFLGKIRRRPGDERTEEAWTGFRAFVGRNANLLGEELIVDDVANAVLCLASDDSRFG